MGKRGQGAAGEGGGDGRREEHLRISGAGKKKFMRTIATAGQQKGSRSTHN